MPKFILFIISLLSVTACLPPAQSRYIQTDRGLMPYSRGYCELGILVSNDMHNIYDENSKPISCSGYVMLTKHEAAERGYL